MSDYGVSWGYPCGLENGGSSQTALYNFYGSSRLCHLARGLPSPPHPCPNCLQAACKEPRWSITLWCTSGCDPSGLGSQILTPYTPASAAESISTGSGPSDAMEECVCMWSTCGGVSQFGWEKDRQKSRNRYRERASL